VASWSFLSNHGRALLCIARDPEIRLRDVAGSSASPNAGPTTSSARGRYVIKEKDGRRNRYQVQGHLPVPEELVQDRAIGDVLVLLTSENKASP
jgi:hypothetical protein